MQRHYVLAFQKFDGLTRVSLKLNIYPKVKSHSIRGIVFVLIQLFQGSGVRHNF